MNLAPPYSPPRKVLVVLHASRPEAWDEAREVVSRLHDAGIEPLLRADDAARLAGSPVGVASDADPAEGCELVVVLGGDGTILQGADLARPHDVPLLGVNLGHVGFLAEAEQDDLDETVERIVRRDYDVEERLALELVITRDGGTVAEDWALNEVSVEKAARQRMIDVLVEIDGRPLSRWGADGVICATPTGSTAYAFSAGGPVIWPEVEALLLVPISAHALFARPVVVAPSAELALEIPIGAPHAVLWCDGRRSHDLQAGDNVVVRRAQQSVRLARLHRPPFTDRLVAKFALPITGWRQRLQEPAS